MTAMAYAHSIIGITLGHDFGLDVLDHNFITWGYGGCGLGVSARYCVPIRPTTGEVHIPPSTEPPVWTPPDQTVALPGTLVLVVVGVAAMKFIRRVK